MENENTLTVDGAIAENNAGESQQAAKTYSAEEVEKLIQAETDRRTEMALRKQQKEYEKKISLVSLDEQQRKEAEANMRIEELQAQLAEFQVERNKAELKSVLSSRGLDVRFADIINITDDLGTSQKNIDTLDTLFKAAVKAEVEKRLAGNTPKGNGSSPAEITKEQASKMSLQEMMELQKNHPEIYNKLFL